MTKKAKSKKQNDRKQIVVQISSETDKDLATARAIINPAVQAAATLKAYNPDDLINVNSLITELGKNTAVIHKGDLKQAETMLVSQAFTLDALFGEFARRAKNSEYLNNLKIYMNVALRSQSQCRATLEALAEIKNPRPYIQHNRAEYQQVNNGALPSRTEENTKITNGLLEDQTDESNWMDRRTPEDAGRTNPEMETLEEIHRAQNQ